ncbi:MAG: hypothetical protein SFX73_10460 [Kofleriaceae bacterium]|nr:hypothetical protein [Kofleriaceae bacterium]
MRCGERGEGHERTLGELRRVFEGQVSEVAQARRSGDALDVLVGPFVEPHVLVDNVPAGQREAANALEVRRVEQLIEVVLRAFIATCSAKPR